MRKEARDHLKVLAAEGWRYLGQVNSGHLLLEHESGAKMTIGNTPSDRRGRLTELSRARRKVRTLEERRRKG